MRYTEKTHPIQWISDKEYCHWKNYGEMTPEKTFELFKIDGDIHCDVNSGVVIGNILYTNDVKAFKLDSGFNMNEIDEIRELTEIQSINYDLLKEFQNDLDDYYESAKDDKFTKDLKLENYGIY